MKSDDLSKVSESSKSKHKKAAKIIKWKNGKITKNKERRDLRKRYGTTVFRSKNKYIDISYFLVQTNLNK